MGKKELEQLLANPSTSTSRVFNEYLRRLKLRAKQTAFHPDGEQKLSIWERRSLQLSVLLLTKNNIFFYQQFHRIFSENSHQKIFSDEETRPSFKDLLSGNKFTEIDHIELKPYQTVWLEQQGW